MTNQELERQLRDWYAVEIGSSEAAPPSLYQRLAVVSETTALGAPTPLYRRMSLLAAAALLAALAAGAVAIGSGWVKLPPLVPAPLVVVVPDPSGSPSVEASPVSATPFPSSTPAPSDGPAPWIVFGGGDPPDAAIDRAELSAMRADGSDHHVITEGGPLAWSKDGTRLLVLKRAFPEDGSIFLAEVGAEIGPFVDTGIKEPTNEQWEAFDFAPDGERVVFMRKSKCASRSGSSNLVLARYVAETPGENCHVLSVLDLRTGELTDLDETLVNDSSQPGNLELPAWSPDGSKIAYTRSEYGPSEEGRRELWVVNADGTNPSRVALAADVPVQEPRWSPDGTQISFTSQRDLSDGGPVTSAVYVAELATGRLDRITTGQGPASDELCCADWLDDAHLRVSDPVWPYTYRFWVVALDATPHESQLLVDLTDALAPIGVPTMRSAPGDPGRMFFWQPTPASQP